MWGRERGRGAEGDCDLLEGKVGEGVAVAAVEESGWCRELLCSFCCCGWVVFFFGLIGSGLLRGSHLGRIEHSWESSFFVSA